LSTVSGQLSLAIPPWVGAVSTKLARRIFTSSKNFIKFAKHQRILKPKVTNSWTRLQRKQSIRPTR